MRLINPYNWTIDSIKRSFNFLQIFGKIKGFVLFPSNIYHSGIPFRRRNHENTIIAILIVSAIS